MKIMSNGVLYEAFLRQAEVGAVWNKGRVVPNFDQNVWRWDCYGAVMKRSEYGNCNSKFGWEIDHIYPKERGGSEDLSNKQPLQWENNRKKGQTVPVLGGLYGL